MNTPEEPTTLPLLPEPEIAPAVPEAGEPVAESRQDRMVRLAYELLVIGVSQPQVTKLLGHDLDLIERQLQWLPYRKARKPASMIVSAIEQDFDAPSALWEVDG